MAAFWDRIAFAYDLAEGLNRRAVGAMAAETARLTPVGALALDCACGTGTLALAMAGRARRVWCTDLSQAMLLRAGRRASRLGLHHLSFALRDVTALPEGDGTLDLSAAGNVLHLLEHPERAVSELLRVTRPGGLVLLPTFLHGEISDPAARLALRLWRLLGFSTARTFDRASYRAFLEGCGASIQQFSVLPGRIPVGLAVLRP